MADYDIDVRTLEAKAAVISVILEDGGVFGPKDEWSAQERHHFVGIAVRHALDPMAFDSLVVTYRSGVRLSLNTRTVRGHAEFSEVIVSPYRERNPHIDYADLQRQLQEVLVRT